MGKKGKTKMIQKMFDSQMRKHNIDFKFNDMKDFFDVYEEYRKYLQKREQEMGTGTVNFKDTTQLKYCALYDFSVNEVNVMQFNTCKIPGATYTTCKEAITEYVEKVGIDKFRMHIVGVK